MIDDGQYDTSEVRQAATSNASFEVIEAAIRRYVLHQQQRR
jgi:hypothetical protein